MHTSKHCDNPSVLSLAAGIILLTETAMAPNLFAMSDNEILNQIYKTHVCGDEDCDVESLFNLAGNILGHSIHIVDDVVQMSCKEPGGGISHNYNTTLAILKKLSSYDWDAKAVLTLAAFAFRYGEFWHLYQLQATDPLAKSLAVLKRVPELTRPRAIKNRGQDIAELNNLIKKTLEVMELIFELEKLTLTYDTKKVPALASVLTPIPIDVFWAIITVVAVVTQVNCLTKDSMQNQDLSFYRNKIDTTHGRLKNQIADCQQQIVAEEAEYIAKIYRYLRKPTEIMQVIKLLIFPKKTDVAEQLLFDGATNQMVKINEALESKNVILFISTLDITDDEIEVLKPVYDHIKKDKKDKYKIVWIPINERWNVDHLKDKYKTKFDNVKGKMEWYVAEQFAFTGRYKFIKEEWHFKKQPIVVVMNMQSKVIQSNAFHIINSYGTRAFPFDADTLENLLTNPAWVEPVIGGVFTTIADRNKYIFIYGGKDEKWISQGAASLANDIESKANISTELFCVEQQDETLKRKFWSGIASLFVTKIQTTLDNGTLELQKLLSYRNETGWVLLVKDSSVVLSGHQIPLSTAVAKFPQWGRIADDNFKAIFRAYYAEIVTNTGCFDFEIPYVSGKLPESVWCAHCTWLMDSYIHYKCCHTKIPMANGAY